MPELLRVIGLIVVAMLVTVNCRVLVDLVRHGTDDIRKRRLNPPSYLHMTVRGGAIHWRGPTHE